MGGWIQDEEVLQLLVRACGACKRGLGHTQQGHRKPNSTAYLKTSRVRSSESETVVGLCGFACGELGVVTHSATWGQINLSGNRTSCQTRSPCSSWSRFSLMPRSDRFKKSASSWQSQGTGDGATGRECGEGADGKDGGVPRGLNIFDDASPTTATHVEHCNAQCHSDFAALFPGSQWHIIVDGTACTRGGGGGERQGWAEVVGVPRTSTTVTQQVVNGCKLLAPLRHSGQGRVSTLRLASTPSSPRMR